MEKAEHRSALQRGIVKVKQKLDRAKRTRLDRFPGGAHIQPITTGICAALEIAIWFQSFALVPDVFAYYAYC